MTTAVARAANVHDDPQMPISAYERALIFGDITGLDERGRLDYLRGMCAASGLDPATRAFGYMEQWAPGGSKLVFYLTATGAAQLRTNHGISITNAVDNGEVQGEKGPCYRWTVYGRTADGREDVEIGSVPLYKAKPRTDGTHELLIGLDYENARKKCLTQAKTRLAKSLTGLAGVLSEDEVDGSPTPASPAPASQGRQTDRATGLITEGPEPASIDQLSKIQKMWQRLQTYDDSVALPDLKGCTADQARGHIAAMTALGQQLRADADARAAEAPATKDVPIENITAWAGGEDDNPLP